MRLLKAFKQLSHSFEQYVFIPKNVKNVNLLHILLRMEDMEIQSAIIFVSTCRWQFPNAENSFSASTANELLHDKYTPVNSEKLKAAAAGLSQIAKAFAAATAIVFGGATLTIGLAVTRLELHTTDDIRTKGKDIVRPKFESIKEQVALLRTWAAGVSKKWHMEKEEDIKERPLIKELSRMLGAKRST